MPLSKPTAWFAFAASATAFAVALSVDTTVGDGPTLVLPPATPHEITAIAATARRPATQPASVAPQPPHRPAAAVAVK